MSRLENGEQRPCSGCGVRIVGANSKTGTATAPIEAAAHENGNVLIQRQADGRVIAVTFGPVEADVLRGMGVELRMNHFATCPEADRFRPTQTEGTGT